MEVCSKIYGRKLGLMRYAAYFAQGKMYFTFNGGVLLLKSGVGFVHLCSKFSLVEHQMSQIAKFNRV
jgi:hypothetical protein